MSGVRLRDDFDGGTVRAVAKTAKDGPQVRRLLALAAIYEGATRGAAARIGGVTLQIVRDPVLRFNASGPVGLINRKAPGAVPDLGGADPGGQAPPGAGAEGRAGADTGRSRRGALADRRSLRVGSHGISARHYPADPEPGTARHGHPQALGPSASPRAGGRCDRGF